MIQDISKSNFKDIYVPDEGYISYDLLKICQPYFDIDLPNADPEEKIQWFKNIFWLTTHFDLGLAHSVHHNQAGRNYIHVLEDLDFKEKILGKDNWLNTIGSDIDLKPSSTVHIKKVDNGWVLNGEANWLTNVAMADYSTIPALDDNGQKYKVVVDLNTVEHELKTDWDLITGMRMARPGTLVLKDALIPETHCLGAYSYPNKFHYEEALNATTFMSSMTANVVALFKQVKAFATNIGRERDMTIIQLEIDVYTMINAWLRRLQQYKEGGHASASEAYWVQYAHIYLFGKKTLHEALNVSRMFGMQQHLIRDGEHSRVFRNAVTFSSHMLKLQDYNNLWGNDDHNEVDLDAYLGHHLDNIIDGTPVPETLDLEPWL